MINIHLLNLAAAAAAYGKAFCCDPFLLLQAFLQGPQLFFWVFPAGIYDRDDCKGRASSSAACIMCISQSLFTQGSSALTRAAVSRERLRGSPGDVSLPCTRPASALHFHMPLLTTRATLADITAARITAPSHPFLSHCTAKQQVNHSHHQVLTAHHIPSHTHPNTHEQTLMSPLQTVPQPPA
jgi:hypothetical protein